MVSTHAQATEKLRPVIAILRRSNMSAIAPAGTATSISGNISAVCTSATSDASEVSLVISHAAATPRMSWPKLEITLADQMRRNTGARSGANAPTRFVISWPVSAFIGLRRSLAFPMPQTVAGETGAAEAA